MNYVMLCGVRVSSRLYLYVDLQQKKIPYDRRTRSDSEARTATRVRT